MKENIKFYTNSIVMFLGVIGYVLGALAMQFDYVLLLLVSIPFVMLFSYGVTVGGFLSFLQIFYGGYKLYKIKESKHKHHFYNGIFWAFSYFIFYIATVHFNLVLTV